MYSYSAAYSVLKQFSSMPGVAMPGSAD